MIKFWRQTVGGFFYRPRLLIFAAGAFFGAMFGFFLGPQPRSLIDDSDEEKSLESVSNAGSSVSEGDWEVRVIDAEQLEELIPPLKDVVANYDGSEEVAMVIAEEN